MKLRPQYFLWGVAVLPFLYFIQNPKIGEPVHELSLSLAKPFILAGHSVSYVSSGVKNQVAHFWYTFRDKRESEKKITELESKLLEYQETKNENERLKKLLSFKESIKKTTIGARVIGWDLTQLRKTVILNKGSFDGLKKGMAVVTDKGLVGRVLESGTFSARVILLTDPDARASAITQDSRTHGMISGDGTLFLRMRYLELDSGVAIGENVISSGVGGHFPDGIAIGKIQGIERDDSGLHLVARVEPFVQFSKLEEVLCVESSVSK